MNRRMSILFIFMLIFQLVSGSVLLPAQTSAEGSNNIIEGISFVDQEGKLLNIEELEEGEVVNVQVSWSLSGMEVQSGLTENYSLPEGLLIVENQAGNLIVGDYEIGTYEANTDGTITVTFSGNPESLEEANGLFVIEGEVGATEDKLALAEDGDPKAITENVIDEFKLLRKDGTEFEEGEFIEVDEDLRFELDWSLPNDHDYKTGDYFEFQLPNQLQVYNEIAGDLGEYGSYVVTTDGKVTFTFNEKIENDSNVQGDFWFDTELDEQEVKSTTEELEITYNDDVLKKITINVKPTGGQAIHKEGQPVGGDFNTEEIEWTVIVNTTRDALENAIVNDPILILEGQELVTDSIVLQEVEVDISGKITEELDIVTDFINNSTKEELNIALGDTNKAYKLTFTTKITEAEKDKEGWLWYSNTAYLNSDGQDEKQSGAGVSVQRPESLVKTSSNFDKDDRSVEWEVKANFTEKRLKAGDTITDEFTFIVGENELNDVFEIIEEEIEILQVDSFDNNGNPNTTSNAKDLFDITIDGNKVTYTLKKDSSNAFILKYKTKAKAGAYITDDGTISNTVEIDGKTDESSQGVIQQVGKKTNAGIDYENKTIDWTITINADKQELRNFILKDNFSGSGQKLVDGSIEISPENLDATINLSPDEIPVGEGFEIDFGNITDTYTITYQTEFTYDFEGEGTPNFKNDVYITYETSGGKDYNLVIKDNVNPNKETKSNGAKNGTANNETKEITWTVDINYNQLELENAKLIDEIAENQSLVDGSVKIYPTTIDKDGKITSGEATDQFDVNTDNDVINIDFGAIDQSYRVEFITIDKDGVYNSDEVYENTAQFIPREGEEHNLKANVTLPNQGEFLGKSGLHNREDWTIDWEVDVNKSKSKLTDVKVKDDLGSTDAQILLEDSINVTKEGSDEELVEGEDYNLTVDGNELTVHFPGEINDHYKVTYSSYIVAEEDADIKNEAEIESVDEVIVGSTETTETVQVKISTGGGTGEGETGGLIIEKIEAGTDRALEDVAFELVKEVGNQKIVVREGTTDADGKLEWKGLKFGDYTLNEVIPEGYLGEEEQTVTISSEDPEGIKTLPIENERQTGIAKIVKVDAATGDKLIGAVFKITNQTTGQTYTFTTKETGEISEKVPFGEYTVEEITAPEGYRITNGIDNITVEVDQTTEITVTNEAIVEVTGTKTWYVDSDHTLPESITVKLYADDSDEPLLTQPVTASDDWKYSFTNLDKYDAEGNEIEYSIEEVELDGFVSEKDGYDLTNIQTIDISGEKTWVEVDDNFRPDEITVNLLANEDPVETTKASAETNWTFDFTNLAKYDLEGNLIDYTIKEVDHNGYTSEIKDFNITNTQVTTDISGTKIWKDNNDATGDRPELITVHLLQNGVIYKTIEEVRPNEDGEWNYTFTNLPKFDKDGLELGYTVDEDPVEGYEKSTDGHNLINTRTGITEVSGEKIWKDANDSDRPDSITVNLLQNGRHFESEVVTPDEDGNWTYSFTDLPEFDENGVAWGYTVDEEPVEGYEKSAGEGYDLINTRTGTTEVTGEKIWKDADASDRPESITVNLLRNGVIVAVQEVTPDEDGNWTYVFTHLPEFDENGIAWGYTVDEEPVEGYAKSAGEGNDLINTRIGITEVSGEKIWKDENESDRPESITVNLFQNGSLFAVEVVTPDENGDWVYSFNYLPQFDSEGQPFVYTVSEHDVPGYAAEIHGFDITNTRADVKTIEITKEWIDGNADDRPESIEVNLYRSIADGDKELVDTVTITAATDWKYSFTDLPEFDENGVAYVYTVQEQAVAGYTTTVDGYDITNTLNPQDPGTSDSEGKDIPKTATNMFNMIAVGLVLLLTGLLGLMYIRKTNNA